MPKSTMTAQFDRESESLQRYHSPSASGQRSGRQCHIEAAHIIASSSPREAEGEQWGLKEASKNSKGKKSHLGTITTAYRLPAA